MNSFTLDEIYVGQKASVTKTITRGDIYAFAGLVDDYSPVHIDKAFGEQSPFGRCIAHGFLSGALFSTLAGNYLPGAGSLYVRQSLNFSGRSTRGTPSPPPLRWSKRARRSPNPTAR